MESRYRQLYAWLIGESIKSLNYGTIKQKKMVFVIDRNNFMHEADLVTDYAVERWPDKSFDMSLSPLSPFFLLTLLGFIQIVYPRATSVDTGRR